MRCVERENEDNILKKTRTEKDFPFYVCSRYTHAYIIALYKRNISGVFSLIAFLVATFFIICLVLGTIRMFICVHILIVPVPHEDQEGAIPQIEIRFLNSICSILATIIL